MSRFNVGVNSVFKVGIENGVYRLERGIKFKGEKISIDDIKAVDRVEEALKYSIDNWR